LKYIDNINTAEKESIYTIVTASLKKTALALKDFDANQRLPWAKFKQPGIYHIADKGKSALLPFARTNLYVGGNGNIINAVTQSHGPSWRMIVQLSSPTEAYGVYPAGQSGNPGSQYFDNFVDTWVAGKYYSLWYMREGDRLDKKVKWTISFENMND
jgi:penicillin amidase